MYKHLQRRRPSSEPQTAEQEDLTPHFALPEPPSPEVPTSDEAEPAAIERPEVQRAGPARYTVLPPGSPPPPTDGPVTIQPALPDFQCSTGLPLQRTDDLANRIRGELGKGTPLEPGVQRTLEAGLGESLSGTRVHTDPTADALARSVQAVAFTTGSDIFFRQGAYNPETPQGLHLLAHEASHTVQQSRGPVDGTPHPGGVSISDPGDRFERAASRTADTAMAMWGSRQALTQVPASHLPVQRRQDARQIFIQRKKLNAGEIVTALEGVPFLKKQLGVKLKIRRPDNKTFDADEVKARVQEILQQYETNLAGTSGDVTDHAMMLAAVLTEIARVIAWNELNDPALTPTIAAKLFEVYRSDIEGALHDMDQLTDALKLTGVLIGDDPLALYMHTEISKLDAADRIGAMATSAGISHLDMFKLLRKRFEVEMASLTRQQVAAREDWGKGGNKDKGEMGSYGIREASGEISVRYFNKLFGQTLGDTAAPAWKTKSGSTEKYLDFAAAAVRRLDALETEITTPSARKTITPRQGSHTEGLWTKRTVVDWTLTAKQTQHLEEIEAREAALNYATVDSEFDQMLKDFLGLTRDDQATPLRNRIKQNLHRLPITITVSGDRWFGAGVPTDTQYKSGASRRNVKSYADLFEQPTAGGSVNYLGEWTRGPHDTQDRGINYNRFRAWKDVRQTKRVGLSEAELPVFAAVNVNWAAHSSQAANDATTYGVNPYGDVHFLMKRDRIKDRAVYTAGDLGRPHRDPYLAVYDMLKRDWEIGRFRQSAQQKTLWLIINAVTVKQMLAFNVQPFEVQIFGPVDISKDVEKIYAAASVSKTVKDNIKAFSKQYDVPYEFLGNISAKQRGKVQGYGGMAHKASSSMSLVHKIKAKEPKLIPS